MASNTDTGWILKQAMFQNAIEGEDLRNRLIDCLEMLYTSHSLRVNNVAKDKVTTYVFTITNNTKNQWAVEVKSIINFTSEGVTVPLEKVYNVSYKSATKKKPFKLNDRFKLYHNGNYWEFDTFVVPTQGPSGWTSPDSFPVGTELGRTTYPPFED